MAVQSESVAKIQTGLMIQETGDTSIGNIRATSTGGSIQGASVQTSTDSVQTSSDSAQTTNNSAQALAPEPIIRHSTVIIEKRPMMRPMYMVFHTIISIFAIYLSFKCNNGFNFGSFLMALFFPHLYIIYKFATSEKFCGLKQ